MTSQRPVLAFAGKTAVLWLPVAFDGEQNPMSATRTTLLVGTTKGAFLISGGTDRSGWTIGGPYCNGWPINHMIGDPETGTLWAGGGGDWNGAGVWRSDDGGASWTVDPSHQGNDGRLGRQGSQCRQDDRLDRSAATVRRLVFANLVAQLRARHAVRRHQAGDPAGQHQRRQGLGQGERPHRSPVRRQLDARRRRADAAHHPARSG